MNAKKLTKLRAQLVAMRRSPFTASDIEAVATRLGRTKVNRGKEPMWVNQHFTTLTPLAIPHHGGGKDLSIGVRKSILNQLEDDLLAWEDWLEEHGDDGDESSDE